MPAVDSFEPDKRTLGQLLASTSPPLRVPDYQRDYSWENEQVSEFWEDIIAFAGNDPAHAPNGEYFLGATVLVNSGSYHLVLDGQQRLATATILLAAIRDKMVDYKDKAAQQIQDTFILFVNQVNGATVARLELNIFDRGFFREFIQTYPRVAAPSPTKKSHFAIKAAYDYFAVKITEGWDKVGGGKNGFEWLGHITGIVQDHVAFILAVATNDKSAASIFTTLNDRGIGLSSVDLVRSYILQNANETQRPEILECWDTVFETCGRSTGAESFMRMSWVSDHGDIKSRALYKVVTEDLEKKDKATAALDYSRRLKSDALLYRSIRDGVTDDPDLESCWLSLKPLKFQSGYPLFIAAANHLELDDQRMLGYAVRALVFRHNIICGLERSVIESTAFTCAKMISDKKPIAEVIAELRKISPSEAVFNEKFSVLKFTVREHSVARYLLELVDDKLSTTGEVDVADASRVHVEHIYPQEPKPEERWTEHATYIYRLGNLTLLDKRLNAKIKNAMFPTKKPEYAKSRLMVTKALLAYDDWSPDSVKHRQAELLKLAIKMWPQNLVEDKK